MKKLLKKIDYFLLPQMGKHRVLSYVWLLYLSIFFVSLTSPNISSFEYIISFFGTLAFLFFYFHSYWGPPRTVVLDILAILAIGTLLSTITSGASVFFVYAGAFCCRLGNPKNAALGLGLIALWIVSGSWLLDLNVYFYVPALLFSLLIGGVNVFQCEMGKKQVELELSQQEIKMLAKTAERERIARDLHDLIGHTFSVITLKAELSAKLIKIDANKAYSEIKELENISRSALSQIREVVTGYRTADLIAELAHAKYVLESNDIHFEYQLDALSLDEVVDKELAIILKELVTNVLKHASASKVTANISLINSEISFDFHDNGKGAINKDETGFGLKGIHERVANLSGHCKVFTEQGFNCKIQIPCEVSQ